MINPLSAVGGINALHTAVQAIRSAIGIIADIRSAGGKANKQQEEAIDTAITLANQNAAIAEAQLALSFGYELCKCEFPPTPMRTVGRHIKATAHGRKETRCMSAQSAVTTPPGTTITKDLLQKN